MFWIVTPLLYLIFLGAGLLLPGVVLWHRAPLSWSDIVIYVCAAGLIVLANVVICLIITRPLFPRYWWMGQVEGKDVFEFEGIYFLGVRITRIPTRLQRILFGVDDQMRVWDLAYGVLFLVMLAPHTMAFLTAQEELDARLPNPARLTESLHAPTLANMPLLREWNEPWHDDQAFNEKLERTLTELKDTPVKNNLVHFQMAQIYLLKAFRIRARASEPYLNSPGERIVFDRTMGNLAREHLKILLDLPKLERAEWRGSALALMGLYHISDGNYPEAANALRQAVGETGTSDEAGLSRYQILLLAGQAALLNGRENAAIDLLERVLVNEQLPNVAYALAMEQLSDALRLKRQWDKAGEMLDKALELYKLEQDRAGVARVHLHRAALALDTGDLKQASEELSIASSIAHGLNDAFTLNMIAQLALTFPG